VRSAINKFIKEFREEVKAVIQNRDDVALNFAEMVEIMKKLKFIIPSKNENWSNPLN
jgi:hypothetical protein